MKRYPPTRFTLIRFSAFFLAASAVRVWAADAGPQPAAPRAAPPTTAPAQGQAAAAPVELRAPGSDGPIEAGFVSLFDGKTFDGWKMANENQAGWKIEDGAIVTGGNRSHLYYIGDGVPFKNFDLRVDVMTQPGSNGGIYIHTRYQETGFPAGGFEIQVNNSHTDWKRTGSIYDIANIPSSPAVDGKWFTEEIMVQGSRITILIDGKRVLEYTEPPGVTPGRTYERKLGEGTFALQMHDPNSVVRYKNIRVRRLP